MSSLKRISDALCVISVLLKLISDQHTHVEQTEFELKTGISPQQHTLTLKLPLSNVNMVNKG